MRILSAASPKSFITIAGEITPPNPQQPESYSDDPAAQQDPGLGALLDGKQEAAPGNLSCAAVELSERGCAGWDAGIQPRVMTGISTLKQGEKKSHVMPGFQLKSCFAADLGLLSTGRRERESGTT